MHADKGACTTYLLMFMVSIYIITSVVVSIVIFCLKQDKYVKYWIKNYIQNM